MVLSNKHKPLLELKLYWTYLCTAKGGETLKLSIMQPYFVPYLGYFSLIKHTDHMILLDSVKFIRHGWIERNRILKPDSDWQYIRVPLKKHSSDSLISVIEIDDTLKWKEKIFSQLLHYKKRAPFYNETIKLLENALDIDTNSIVKLNENILMVICEYLDLQVNLSVFSEMDMHIQKPNAADEWALNICTLIDGVTEYWNLEGGAKFFNPKKYTDAGIDIKFMKTNLRGYPQKRRNFEAGLSIIDVLMFNNAKEINMMLDDYIFLDQEVETAGAGS